MSMSEIKIPYTIGELVFFKNDEEQNTKYVFIYIYIYGHTSVWVPGVSLCEQHVANVQLSEAWLAGCIRQWVGQHLPPK